MQVILRNSLKFGQYYEISFNQLGIKILKKFDWLLKMGN